jgi:hypothetical protein
VRFAARASTRRSLMRHFLPPHQPGSAPALTGA